jgi:cystathionine gamma-synthase
MLIQADLVAVKKVYYPKYSDTRQYYDKCRTPNGGYGGLLSAVKGPSLGTNFTLRYN